MSSTLFEAVCLAAETILPGDRRVLEALMRAPAYSASAGEIRTMLEVSTVIEVNAAIGRFGLRVHQLFGRHPDGYKNGDFEWWTVLATGLRDNKRGFVWTLREEVIQGLHACGFGPQRQNEPGTSALDRSSPTDAEVEAFHDAGDVSDHEAFQAWRISHPDGFYLNLETRNKAKLHGCNCWHAGSANLSAAELGGSLTLKKKVCSENPVTLLSWANDYHVSVTGCAHCIDREALASVASPTEQTSPTDVTAIEGVIRETAALTKGRNRGLRDAALARSLGVCAACGIDFSRVLSGKGYRALQVHHTRQLSLQTEPAVTSIDELAVVCANCHALIHADPFAAMPVATLRELWAVERTNGDSTNS